MVSKSQYAIPIAFEKPRACFIVCALSRQAMLIAVNFNNQAFAVRDKIQNVFAEGRLTANVKTERPAMAELAPQDPFRLGGLASHVVSAGIGHCSSAHGIGPGAKPPTRTDFAFREKRFDRPTAGAVTARNHFREPHKVGRKRHTKASSSVFDISSAVRITLAEA